MTGILYIFIQDCLAEWSKAKGLGSGQLGRGFEPHSCQLFYKARILKFILFYLKTKQAHKGPYNITFLFIIQNTIISKFQTLDLCFIFNESIIYIFLLNHRFINKFLHIIWLTLTDFQHVPFCCMSQCLPSFCIKLIESFNNIFKTFI